MLDGITMGQYLPGKSVLHKTDPRIKLFVVTFSIIGVIISYNWLALCLMCSWTMLVIWFSGIGPGVYWRSLKPLWLLLLISITLQIFFTPGEPLVTAGFLIITREGLINSGWLLWRLTMLLLWASVLTFTTTPLQLTTAVEWLLFPLNRMKVPVRELAMMINLALRFIPTLFEEAQALLMAQMSRGADFTRGSITGRVKGLVPFMVPLLTNIFRRADDLALAMEIRCYQVGAPRSRMTEFRLTTIDYWVFGIGLSVFLAVVVLQYTH